MIKVLVANDNVEENVMLSNFLTKEEDIKVIAMTFNSTNTLSSYISTKPDVLILNLGLPQMNVTEVLNALDEFEEERNKCNVIILSNKFTEPLPPKISKVYRICNKPYDFDTILHSIRQIQFYNKNKKSNYREMCENIFQELGFNLYSLGTKLLIKTVVFLLENKNYATNNLYEIYQQLSNSVNLQPAQIKWKINNTINSMYRYTNKKTIKEVFKEYDGRKPTAKYIILLTINKISNKNLR